MSWKESKRGGKKIAEMVRGGGASGHRQSQKVKACYSERPY